MTHTNGPWTHTSDDSYKYQLIIEKGRRGTYVPSQPSLIVVFFSDASWERKQTRSIEWTKRIRKRGASALAIHGICTEQVAYRLSPDILFCIMDLLVQCLLPPFDDSQRGHLLYIATARFRHFQSTDPEYRELFADRRNTFVRVQQAPNVLG